LPDRVASRHQVAVRLQQQHLSLTDDVTHVGARTLVGSRERQGGTAGCDVIDAIRTILQRLIRKNAAGIVDVERSRQIAVTVGGELSTDPAGIQRIQDWVKEVSTAW
jgi:hypothetical protein